MTRLATLDLSDFLDNIRLTSVGHAGKNDFPLVTHQELRWHKRMTTKTIENWRRGVDVKAAAQNVRHTVLISMELF